jgi:hypothetical protein
VADSYFPLTILTYVDEDGTTKPYEIGEELTIFEAAVIYTGRAPAHVLVGDTDPLNADDREVAQRYFGLADNLEASARDQTRTLGRDIYRELQRRVRDRRIWAARCDLNGGDLNTFTTRIRFSDLVLLARERGDAEEPLRSLAETSGPRANGVRGVTAGGKKQRHYAEEAIKRLWPDGPPEGARFKTLESKVREELREMLKSDSQVPHHEHGISSRSIRRALDPRE